MTRVLYLGERKKVLFAVSLCCLRVQFGELGRIRQNN